MNCIEIINRIIQDRAQLGKKFNWLAVGRSEWAALSNPENKSLILEAIKEHEDIASIRLKEAEPDNYYECLDWLPNNWVHIFNRVPWKDGFKFSYI